MKDGIKIDEYLVTLYKKHKNVKILEYNVQDNVLQQNLLTAGFKNYLGIALKSEGQKENENFYYVNDKNIVRKNNGDVLILNQADFHDLKNALNSSAEIIIYSPASRLDNFSFFPLLVYKLTRKKKWKFQPIVFSDEYTKKKAGIVFKRKHIKEKTARHYLSPKVSMEDFFDDLNKRGLNHVILRWYDKIPFADLNEDIDLLVSDENINEVQNILNEKVGIIPFDVYSSSGLPGSDFKNIAYYPPYLAERILKNRKLWKGKYFIPDKKDHFLSLMYHAVYHKGEASGIPVKEKDKMETAGVDHDYYQILQALAVENNTELKEMNLMYLHQFLDKEGWAPATDTIRKLCAGKENWLQSIIKTSEYDFGKNGEIMVFVVREWAYNRGLTGFIVDWFEKRGLNLVKKIDLDEQQMKEAAQNLRGGNWGRGPWPVSGGVPSVLLVFYDYHPKPLEKNYKKKYPYVSNPLYLIKEDLRAEVNAFLPAEEKTNPIHSADDEIEALEYIVSVAPEIMDEVKRTVLLWDEIYKTKEPIIKDLSENRRRAKVELIEYKGQKAVKKTYKAGNERFLEREKYVYGELSKECEFIPKLIESGENYIIIPFLEISKDSNNLLLKRRLLKEYKKEIIAISEFFYKKGYAVIDFHPGNLLITKDGLKIIDFEFLYRYESLPKSSRHSFDLVGFPEDFAEDKPLGIKGEYIRKHWKKILS